MLTRESIEGGVIKNQEEKKEINTKKEG